MSDVICHEQSAIFLQVTPQKQVFVYGRMSSFLVELHQEAQLSSSALEIQESAPLLLKNTTPV
jgi:hypothetical protein